MQFCRLKISLFIFLFFKITKKSDLGVFKKNGSLDQRRTWQANQKSLDIFIRTKLLEDEKSHKIAHRS
jgi:hypothetical protein